MPTPYLFRVPHPKGSFIVYLSAPLALDVNHLRQETALSVWASSPFPQRPSTREEQHTNPNNEHTESVGWFCSVHLGASVFRGGGSLAIASRT